MKLPSGKVTGDTPKLMSAVPPMETRGTFGVVINGDLLSKCGEEANRIPAMRLVRKSRTSR